MTLKQDEGTVSRTSVSMLQAAREDDPAAWRRMVDTYSRRIYRWCRQAGVPAEDAGDISQEVFRAVARKLMDFQRDRAGDSFRGWLFSITRNKVRDYFRHRSLRDEIVFGGTDAQRKWMAVADSAEETDGSNGHPDGNAWGSPRRHWVELVRAEFSQRDWQVFWRVVVDGQTAREAGEEQGMSSNAVRLVKMRILRRFRQLAKADGHEAGTPPEQAGDSLT